MVKTCLKSMIVYSLFFSLWPQMVSANPGFDHSYPSWKKVLEQYVENGWVNYRELLKNPKDLRNFLNSISQVSREEYDRWSRSEQIAFWINIYNAYVIHAILEHYPIERKPGWTALVFPKNSIWQIPNVWKRKTIEVFEKKLSLDEIENQMLRREFKEPRIHFALNCASLGCPKLRKEPYAADRLDNQLEDETRKFFSDPEKFRFDADTNTVFLSPIFKWFSKDFGEAGGVISFLKGYVPQEIAARISGTSRIQWLKYDWSLNDSET